MKSGKLSKISLFGRIIGIVVIFAFPCILIYLINMSISLFSIKNNYIPLLHINMDEEIKISEYIAMYVAVLGIEITAILSWVIHKLSISKEMQEKNDKIKKCRNKVYISLINSLENLFQKYLFELFTTNEYLDKFIPIEDSLEDYFINLDIDGKHVEIYRYIYIDILNIKRLKEEGKKIFNHLDEMFKKITLDFYYYYKRELGTDIRVSDILKLKYINAFNELSIASIDKTKSQYKYINGNLMYIKKNNNYIVYNKKNEKLCDCTFENSMPYSGWARLYSGGEVYYEGTIENGVEIKGMFFNCEIDKNNKTVISNNKPNFIGLGRFKDNEYVLKNNIKHGKDYRIANIEYINNEYVVDKNTIKEGKLLLF
ncbi:UNVERIFIED_CONTAM: hypothetical protein Cloal_0727 [Acetivibrio alkalicellulosi]